MLLLFRSKALPRFARCASSKSANATLNHHEDEIQKSVFISQSSDIYVNLALEDWLYRNSDFSKHHVLLLWRSDPCVVIGRHQNPWLECNMPALESSQVVLARRNSGGGAVYQDLGNLNLSFLTPRERYNRRHNLQIIQRALFREWNLECSANAKEDIVVGGGGFKVSGTAAKLGPRSAYHHCTLLVDVDEGALSWYLRRTEAGIATNATKSTRSPVRSLAALNSHVSVERVLSAIGREYLRAKAVTLEDGGRELLERQRGFQMLNPTEDWFPGIGKLTEEFRSWNWIYGKSPKFGLTRFLEAANPAAGTTDPPLKLVISVDKGIVREATMTLPSNLNQYGSLITNLSGKRYSDELVNSAVRTLGCKFVRMEGGADTSSAVPM